MKKISYLMFGLLFSAPVFAVDFTGTWSSGCVVLEDGSSSRTDLVVTSATEMTWEFYDFSDSACTQAIIETKVPVLYAQSGVNALDMTLQAYHLTYLTQAYVDSRNQSAFCGISTWTLGQAQNIAGLTCGEGTAPAAGHMYFDLVSVEGDKLMFGKFDETHDGTSAATRPVEIDNASFFTKVQ